MKRRILLEAILAIVCLMTKAILIQSTSPEEAQIDGKIVGGLDIQKFIKEEDYEFNYHDKHLSIYDYGIREVVNGEMAKCDCIGICYCSLLYHLDEQLLEDDFYYLLFHNDSLNKIFQIPFESTNQYAVLRCEEHVNEMLWSNWPGTVDIYLVYTDGVIVKYSNYSYSDKEGNIEIYAP